MARKIDWTNHGIEFVTVVVGILLAFWLGNYKEEQKEKLLADQFLQSIEEEIRENKKEIEEKLPYHQGLLQQLIDDPLNAHIQLRSSRVTDYAWQLSNNGIFKEHVDFETYRVLAEVYSKQERLIANNQNTGETMTYLNATTPLMIASGGREAIEITQDTTFRREMRSSWIPIMQDVIYFESDLQKTYDRALEQLAEQTSE